MRPDNTKFLRDRIARLKFQLYKMDEEAKKKPNFFHAMEVTSSDTAIMLKYSGCLDYKKKHQIPDDMSCCSSCHWDFENNFGELVEVEEDGVLYRICCKVDMYRRVLAEAKVRYGKKENISR